MDDQKLLCFVPVNIVEMISPDIYIKKFLDQGDPKQSDSQKQGVGAKKL